MPHIDTSVWGIIAFGSVFFFFLLVEDKSLRRWCVPMDSSAIRHRAFSLDRSASACSHSVDFEADCAG